MKPSSGHVFPSCAVADCDNRPEGVGLCAMHKKRLARTGDVNSVRRSTSGKVTPEVRAEIVRSMRRFENPLALARRLDLTERTIFNVMKAEREVSS